MSDPRTRDSLDSPPPVAALLDELVRHAEAIIAKPWNVIGRKDAIDALADKIGRAKRCSFLHERLVDDDTLFLCRALINVHDHLTERERCARWQKLATGLLEFIRDDLYAARERERG